MADREDDAKVGTRRAEEDLARWVDELMPSRRRPDPEPTLSLSPAQLRIGDRLSDADGEWEVTGNPQTYRGGKDVEARGQRPGQPATVRLMSWPAYEKRAIRRDAR